jgi:hypothetical protein
MEDQKEEVMENQSSQNLKFPKKTFFLIIFLIFVAGGLTTLALYTNRIGVSEIPTPTPVQVLADTVLTISSTPQKQASISAYKVNVDIDTGKNKVTKVQLELSFNPLLLTNVDIIPGPFFDQGQILLKNIDSENGRISFAIKQSPDENGVTGKKSLATILFTTTKALPLGSQISINFEPKTQVSAINTSESVLKSTTGALFILTKAPIKISTGSSFLNQVGTSSAN